MGIHSLTKTFSSLRGFSTDSKFVRPANVSEKAVNIQRLADGTFSPRRGYQVQTSEKGGMGMTVFDNKVSSQQVVTIDEDGLLYLQKAGTFTVAFAPLYDYEWFSYEIFVDEALVSDTTKEDFDPYAVVEWNALVDDSIKFKYIRKTKAIVDGLQSGVTSITVDAGHTVEVGALATFVDDTDGEYTTRTISAIGATTIDISGAAVDVANNLEIDSEYTNELSLGIGFDKASIYTLDNLRADLNLITYVTATIVGEGDTPAAFIEIAEPAVLSKDSSAELAYYYWKDANRTVPKTFSGLADHIDQDDFENATFASFDNLLFIANRFDAVHKFDGQTVYRAGLPTGATPTGVKVPVGALTGAYKWYVTYEQIDATGRLVEGRIGTALEVTLAAENITLTIGTLAPNSGYNTNYAEVNGGQAAVNTIVVDANHSIREGDTAYFLDGVSGVHVTRNVDSTTATSITVDGAAVDVLDTAIISNNLRVNIYRTIAGGTSPYLIATLPNDPVEDPDATITYTDSALDATLVTQYDVPIVNHDPPPQCAYVINYGNQLIYGGNPDSKDSVYFSEPNIPEYVDLVRNRFTVPSNNDNVTGLANPEGYLVIFKTQSIYVIAGNLTTSQSILTQISAGGNIGCISHHSISVIGSLVYFLHTNGVYSMTSSQLFPLDKAGNPIPLSIPIDKFFREDIFDQTERYIFKRSTSINYTKDNQYLLFLPVEPVAANVPERAATSKSMVLCFDYQGKNWFEWTNVNAASGWYVLNDFLYWMERRMSNNNIASNQYRQHRKNRLVDQVDHVTPIHVTWRSSCEDLNQPRIRKVFSRAVLLLDVVSGLRQKNALSFSFKSFKDWRTNTHWTKKNITQVFNANPYSTSQYSYLGEDGYQDNFITINLRSSQVSKACQIQLQLNELNTTFALQGFQLEVDTDFKKEIVR